MEVKEKSKKRELIKTIAIIFLVVLLILTFFSNTLMNYSLPEVSTVAVESGSITTKIRGSGTVAANEKYEVIIDQTREVRTVCVRVGDTVEQGDLLFVLGDMESEELRAAQQALDDLNIQYKTQLLNNAKKYEGEDRELKQLQETLKKATAKRDENKVTDQDISFLKADITRAKNDLTNITYTLETLNAQAGGTEQQEAQAEVDKWKAEVEKQQAIITECDSQLAELNTGGDPEIDRKIQDAEIAWHNAENQLKSNLLAYEAEYRKLATAAGVTFSGTIVDSLNDPDHQVNIRAQLIKMETENPKGDEYIKAKTAYDALMESNTNTNTAKQTYDRLVQDKNNAGSSTDAKRAEIMRRRTDAQNQISMATAQLQQAQYKLSQLGGNNEAVQSQIKAYEQSKRQIEAQMEALNTQLTELEAKKVIYDEAVTTIETTTHSIEEKLSGKDIDKQLDGLGLEGIRNQIEKQQELVDKYTKDTVDTEIKANVSGTISSIDVTAGKNTTAGTPMATIDVVDRGYTIRIPVTNEQARQVRVGDTADVSNYYWGSEIKATLETIVPNPDAPGKGKLLVFRVTGEIDAGATLNLSVGQKSASFDAIVPKSAVREDTNGHFVYTITSKSSPLGNRYYATRVDVQVLAEDDVSTAVSGITNMDYVITASSKPLDAGTMVRMVEDQ